MIPTDRVSTPTIPRLEMRGVTVELGGRTILEGIDLAVRANERVALVGPNGAGKTTLMRALLGLVPTSRGWIRLHGHDPRDLRSRAAGLALTGTAIEQPGLPPQVRTREYLAWWARLHGLESPLDRAESLLADWGIPPDAKAEILSQGQRQILQILRCMVHDPVLLVLDEPTSFLDPDSSQRFDDGIRQWCARTGGGVLLSTHHLEHASGCDRLVTLSEGRLRRQGMPDDLLASHEFTRLLRVDPSSIQDQVEQALRAASPAVASEFAGIVRGCPAWRVACGSGEQGHASLLASLARDRIEVRSLDRDATTLQEFWEASMRTPPQPSVETPPPPAQPVTPSRSRTSDAVKATIGFQISLIARERRMLWPIVVLEGFFLGSTILAVRPGLGPSESATLLLLSGLLPIGLSSSLAADTFAGERERRSLETLLCAPLEPLPLFAAKGFAALAPGQILSWIGFILCAIVVAGGSGGPSLGILLVLGAAVVPSMGLLATTFALTASRRSRSVRSAAQLAAMGLLPLLASAQILPVAIERFAPDHPILSWSAVAAVCLAASGVLLARAASGLSPLRLLRD